MKGMNSLAYKLWFRAYSILNSNTVKEKKDKKIYKINKLLIKTNSKLYFQKGQNITSNKFNRFIHTNTNNSNLNPFYVYGFSDAEATFVVAIKLLRDLI
jgi:hypothetical protein